MSTEIATAKIEPITAGHPWDDDPNWEKQLIIADSEAEMQQRLSVLCSTGWNVWIVDQSEKLALVFRPKGT